jgi:hypothetical protein
MSDRIRDRRGTCPEWRLRVEPLGAKPDAPRLRPVDWVWLDRAPHSRSIYAGFASREGQEKAARLREATRRGLKKILYFDVAYFAMLIFCALM